MAKPSNNERDSGPRKSYVSQSDVPRHSLRDALRIAGALADSFGKAPTKPLLVAQALGLSPTSGTYRMLCGASIGYGLTDGGYNANAITLTPLGMRAVSPQQEGDDTVALREAFMRPRIVREFLSKYNGSRMPQDQIGRNVLESMGVPREATERVLDVIRTGAEDLGLLREIKGQTYVHVDPARDVANPPEAPDHVQSAQGELRTDVVMHGRASDYALQQVPIDSAEHRTFTIPLSRGRTGCIVLPYAVDSTDLQRIKMWLELMEDVLIESREIKSKNTTGSNQGVAPSSGLESTHGQ